MSAILAATIILCGCCSVCRQRQKNAKPLTGTTWHLVQIGGEEMSLPADKYNMTFDAEGRVSGIGACNRFTGGYELSGKFGIHFGPMASTRMYCENIDIESEMLGVLSSATHYDIDYDMLIIISDGTIKALFKAL